MDSTSPVSARTAGQTSGDFADSCKPFFAMAFLTLVENLFVGRRWLLGGLSGDGGHRRYRDYHYRSAGGHGHAS